MIAECTARIGPAPALALGTLLIDQRNSTVEPDGEYVLACRQIGVGLAVLHIRPEAAHAGHDRLAVAGIFSDLAG